jgi:hypothetical protein
MNLLSFLTKDPINNFAQQRSGSLAVIQTTWQAFFKLFSVSRA